MAGSLSAPLIECVANFSEGREPATVRAIEDAIASSTGVVVLRSEMDTDHNRSVITFAGRRMRCRRARCGASRRR